MHQNTKYCKKQQLFDDSIAQIVIFLPGLMLGKEEWRLERSKGWAVCIGTRRRDASPHPPPELIKLWRYSAVFVQKKNPTILPAQSFRARINNPESKPRKRAKDLFYHSVCRRMDPIFSARSFHHPLEIFLRSP